MVERAEKLVSVMCFLHRAFCHKQLFFSCKPSYSSSKSPSSFFIFLFCNSNLLFVLWFCRQCSSILFPAPSPPPIYCILLPTSRIPFAWLTKPRPSSAERCRLSLVTRKEIYGMTTTRFYRCSPAFLYIMRHHWQITMCLVGSQPISLQTQKITPSPIMALSNWCPLSANPGSEFLLVMLPTKVNNMTSVLVKKKKQCRKCVCYLSKDNFWEIWLNLSDPGSFLAFLFWAFMLLIPSPLLTLSVFSSFQFTFPPPPKK